MQRQARIGGWLGIEDIEREARDLSGVQRCEDRVRLSITSQRAQC